MLQFARHGSGFALRLARGVLPVSLPLVSGPADHSAALMARHARTFDLAARFLPEERRRAAITLYAFLRTLDDLVDVPAPYIPTAEARAELHAWRDWLLAGSVGGGPREPLASELARVIGTFRVPLRYLLDLLAGLESDLEPREVQTFDELRRYCYHVAGTVGLAMAHVLGAASDPALAAAENLGTAMQLTNILRDVGEDLAAGRVYLPRQELAAFGTSRERLLALRQLDQGPDAAFRRLMRFQLRRAHAYYQRGVAGIWLLPADSRLPILVATRLYRRILDEIERRDYDSLTRRAATSRWTKTREAAIAFALVSLWRSGEPGPSPDERDGVDDVVVH